MRLEWLDYKGTPVCYATVAPGDTSVQSEGRKKEGYRCCGRPLRGLQLRVTKQCSVKQCSVGICQDCAGASGCTQQAPAVSKPQTLAKQARGPRTGGG